MCTLCVPSPRLRSQVRSSVDRAHRWPCGARSSGDGLSSTARAEARGGGEGDAGTRHAPERRYVLRFYTLRVPISVGVISEISVNRHMLSMNRSHQRRNAAVSVAVTSSNVIERAKSSAIHTFAVSRAHTTTTNRRSTLLTKHC